MRRLNWLVLTALLLAAGCGRPTGEVTEIPARHETATLKSITPVSAAAERTFSARLSAPVDELPPLPFGDKPLRVSSAVQTVARDGADSYAAGDGAVNVGSGKLLTGGAGAISWAVYQLPGLPGSAQLKKLNVNVSGGSFSGNAPGFWVGLANYATESWITLARAEDDYQRLLTGQEFISPGGNMYAFVLVMGAQAVTVDSVAVTYDTVPLSGWSEITLDAGADNGWTPAIALDYYGSVWLAWANHADGTARYAYALATSDMSLLGSWETGYIDQEPTGKARYTDLVIDPRSNLPVASLNYVEQTGGADNSQAGMSVFQIGPQSQHFWLNFAFGKMDGARDTTIDFDPQSSFFGMATYATNANTPANQPNDVYLRYIDLGDLGNTGDNTIKANTGLGEDQFFPHLRFSPAEQRTRLIADGGTLYSNTSHPATDEPPFDSLQVAASTGPFGSIAYNRAATGPRFGITYSKTVGNNHVLFYNSYDSEAAEPTVEEVATIAKQDAGEWIAGTSQLAYTWDGDALIAYTVKQGSSVTVKLARRGQSSWLNETVSSAPSQPGGTPQDVQVDLAVEPFDFFPEFTRSERAYVVWRHISGGIGEVRLAFKAFP